MGQKDREAGDTLQRYMIGKQWEILLVRGCWANEINGFYNIYFSVIKELRLLF